MKTNELRWKFGSALLVVLAVAASLAAGFGSCAVEASVEPSVVVDVTQWIYLTPGVPVDGANGVRTTTLVFSKSIAAFTDNLNFNAGRSALAELFTFSYENGETVPAVRATALVKAAEGVYILTVTNVPKLEIGGKVLVTINTPGITPATRVWLLNEEPVEPELGHIATLLEFRFRKQDNSSLDSDVLAQIDQQQRTVAVLVPYGTPLGALTPTLTLNPGSRSSQVGENDFSNPPVSYTITAEDGITENEYLVTVETAEELTEPPVIDQMITGISLDFITAPVSGENPSPALFGLGQTTTIPFESEKWTAVLIWSIDDNYIDDEQFGVFDTLYTHRDSFWGGAVYTATVVLSAKPGFTFNGVLANSLSYSDYGHTTPADNEHGQITNIAGSGNTLMVTIVFPATAEDRAGFGFEV
jgi:hypothetical protein